MNRFIACTFCFYFLLIGAVSAGEMKTIELIDGSVLSGEVMSLTNGVYTIRTQSMGTLTVPDSKIRSIHARDAAGTSSPPSTGNAAGDIKPLMDKMMSNDEIMGMIQSLKDDPDFANILQDPEVMSAIQNGDTAALTANPKFMKIMNNSTVQHIQKKVAQ